MDIAGDGERFAWARHLGLRYPVVQAGMGGGCAGIALATAVSLAGGLGTLGIMAASEFRTALAETRRRCHGRPYAVNLLMPFTRAAHVEACLRERPAVVVRFYGFGADLVARLKQAGIAVWQQVGDVEQARRALADGVDALIAQGAEAGGHLAAGTLRRDELLAALRQLPETFAVPILAAGGIHDAASARLAIAQGAAGVVAGTRFLLTPEADIHQAYKARLLEARQTVKTSLFSFGWVAPHRVVPNAAVERWTDPEADAPAWVLRVNRALKPGRRLLPLSLSARLVRMQRLRWPFYTPSPLTSQMPAAAVEVTPLYAGECIAAISSLRPAAELVEELASGCGCALSPPSEVTTTPDLRRGAC